jgi:ribosomal protein S20
MNVDYSSLLETTQVSDEFSENFNADILRKIKLKMTDENFKIFMVNLNIYFNHKQSHVIDITKTKKWFNLRMDYLKPKLINNFKENEDYTIKNNGEELLISLNTMLKLCLKCDNIPSFFINLFEGLLSLVINDSKDDIDKYITKFKGKYVVYIICIGCNLYKYGRTSKFYEIFSKHILNFGKDIKIIACIDCLNQDNMKEIEKYIHTYAKVKEINKNNNNKEIMLTSIENVNYIIQTCKTLLGYHDIPMIKAQVTIELYKEYCKNKFSESKINEITKECEEELAYDEEDESLGSVKSVEIVKRVESVVNKNIIKKNKCSSGNAGCTNEAKYNENENRYESRCEECLNDAREKSKKRNKNAADKAKIKRINEIEELNKLRTEMLTTDSLQKCNGCKESKKPIEFGMSLKTNKIYSKCLDCSGKAPEKLEDYLITENECTNTNCMKKFPFEYNDETGILLRTCKECREYDRIVAEENLKFMEENKDKEFIKCSNCPNNFKPEINKKGIGLYRTCIDCRKKPS